MRRNARQEFYQVSPYHAAIHERLLNWARWARPYHETTKISPMFKLYKPKIHSGELVSPAAAIDLFDALLIEQRICKLSRNERTAIIWWYIWKQTPAKAKRLMGCSYSQLNENVHKARSSLAFQNYVFYDSAHISPRIRK